MAKQQYTLGRVFVGDRPLEDLTPEEHAAFQRRTVERMGNVLNNYFSLHTDVYVRIARGPAARNAAAETANPQSADV